jgi:hypothetical protein
MNTNDDIRRRNFELLLAECGGEDRGAAARLAALTGVAPALISQIKAATPHPSGRPRGIGDATARKLEKGMGKEPGFLDYDHSAATTLREADFLDALRDGTPEDQIQILALSNRLRRSRTSSA